ncbi:DUF4747 family protein [Bacteroides togonis]|uniref:DUF4747 family protein n=1 Tax=Bacteroides togonis TaxID=1917883 RepID=UPI00094B0945|nr:DUF4747 family protein [Bacteroides togonis]
MARNQLDEKNFSIQIVNIKLMSNNRQGDEAYKNIVSQIKNLKIHIPIYGENQHMILRTQFSTFARVGEENIEVIYGKISKYVIIDSDDWINLSSMEVENVDLPTNLFPNLKETNYFFIPRAHRFAFVKDQGISANNVHKFLSNAVAQVIENDEQSEVIIEQSEDIFDRIINAESVKKLLISISYSNADTGDEAYEFMDNQIRESEMKRLKLEATPNQNGDIKTGSLLIKGALKVAQSNGYVQATIIENNTKIKIDTKTHPRILNTRCEEVNLLGYVVNQIMNIFRPHSHGN